MKIINLFPDSNKMRFSARGDRQLYDWLKNEINPDFNITTKDELIAYISPLINIKTKIDIMKEKKWLVGVSDFYMGAGHGLSTGIICPPFWQKALIPRLAKGLRD
jgi:hypothetical protein